MNTTLCTYYLNMPIVPEKMQEVSFFDIIPALEQHFKGNWAWEITDETFAMDNSVVCTTVALYTPGRVYTGRSLCKVKDYHENHLRALTDACALFTLKSVAVKNDATNQVVNQQLSPEQIMGLVQGQDPSKAPINSVPQFDNYKDNNGLPNQGVPFNQITDNAFKELEKELVNQPPVSNPAPQEPVQQHNNDAYNAPNPQLNGYSQAQVDRMKNIKTNNDITNDQMLGNWIHTWNSNYHSKKDLNPNNINDFLDWAEDFSKNC